MSVATPVNEGNNVRVPDSKTRPQQYLSMELEPPEVRGIGSAASTFDRKKKGAKTEDIVKDYPWTTSDVSQRYDIPYIVLSEHRNTESTISRNAQFYAKGVVGTASGVSDYVGGSSETKGLLEVYDEIFPDNPTNNKYIFPYFNKNAFELNTGRWEQMDDIGQSIKELGEGASSIMKQFGGFGKVAGEYVDKAIAGGEFMSAAATTALKGLYPVVGIFDRPRIFSAHSERSITIEFPLYNTITPDAWIKNHSFIYKFMSQNMYIKRDFITGIPPVFYRIHVPYQYFCFAACVTKINVENLGNIRLMYNSYRVPDAYQVSITLDEMVMPSLNQFQALITPDANNRVEVLTKEGAAAKASSAKTNSANTKVNVKRNTR
jgi:hypothetical protein